jgi:hypothetical protein
MTTKGHKEQTMTSPSNTPRGTDQADAPNPSETCALTHQDDDSLAIPTESLHIPRHRTTVPTLTSIHAGSTVASRRPATLCAPIWLNHAEQRTSSRPRATTDPPPRASHGRRQSRRLELHWRGPARCLQAAARLTRSQGMLNGCRVSSSIRPALFFCRVETRGWLRARRGVVDVCC